MSFNVVCSDMICPKSQATIKMAPFYSQQATIDRIISAGESMVLSTSWQRSTNSGPQLLPNSQDIILRKSAGVLQYIFPTTFLQYDVPGGPPDSGIMLQDLIPSNYLPAFSPNLSQSIQAVCSPFICTCNGAYLPCNSQVICVGDVLNLTGSLSLTLGGFNLFSDPIIISPQTLTFASQ